MGYSKVKNNAMHILLEKIQFFINFIKITKIKCSTMKRWYFKMVGNKQDLSAS